MPNGAQFTIGDDARCRDGVCGEVSRVVVDPIAQTVTHIVVEPKHRSGLGRLVPLDLVDLSTGEVQLSCTTAAFEELGLAEETHFLPGAIGYAGYSASQVLSWPFFGANSPLPVVTDALPPGEVAIHRGEAVRATDGEVGRVHGLIIDPGDHRVTHVLLQEGHRWGRQDVAIPIGAVTAVDTDGIALNLSGQEVHDLPPVDFDPSRD